MLFRSRLPIFLFLFFQYEHVAAAPSYSPYPPDAVDDLAAQGLLKLKTYQAENDKDNPCTIETASKRREWGDLSPDERIEYTDAVLCLMSKPPITPAEDAPGARSRYDDFVVTHINQAMTTHNTGNFLAFHRYYVWTYEKALREECGYKGYQPYWNWGRYSSDPINSPVFDGSATSMGGNGLFYNYSGIPIPGAPPPHDIVPPGVGGGCVIDGPFKNITVNLGPGPSPMGSLVPGIPQNPQSDLLGYNPRCLRRDVNVHAAAVTQTNYTYELITKPLHADIGEFQNDMQGRFVDGHWGVHVGGHYTIGGDPGPDFYSSPGEPMFYLQHGQIDRVWWIWELQDLANRLTAVAGTRTFLNRPPSENTTLHDIVDLGLNAPGVELGDLLNTMGGLGGEFCYIYV